MPIRAAVLLGISFLTGIFGGVNLKKKKKAFCYVFFMHSLIKCSIFTIYASDLIESIKILNKFNNFIDYFCQHHRLQCIVMVFDTDRYLFEVCQKSLCFFFFFFFVVVLFFKSRSEVSLCSRQKWEHPPGNPYLQTLRSPLAPFFVIKTNTCQITDFNLAWKDCFVFTSLFRNTGTSRSYDKVCPGLRKRDTSKQITWFPHTV